MIRVGTHNVIMSLVEWLMFCSLDGHIITNITDTIKWQYTWSSLSTPHIHIHTKINTQPFDNSNCFSWQQIVDEIFVGKQWHSRCLIICHKCLPTF